MTTLLRIHASLSGATGESSRLAERFSAAWLSEHPQGRVLTRDLSSDPVPHLTAERFHALLAAPHERTPGQQAVVDYSDALIAELKAADVLLFAVPMYNFSVPSTLRAYFDHIARAGVTFRYTADGAQGLITGKRAIVVVTRGGVYPVADDTQTAYLRQFLGFVGIDQVEFVHAEGLAMGDDVRGRQLEAAHDAIARLAAAA